MKVKILFAALAILFSAAANAQDYIRTKKDTIKCKVVEIGLDEIKYKDFDNLDGPIIVIEKNNVIEITYENGKKSLIAPDVYAANQEVAVRHKTHAVKFEFFSPLTDKLAFSYETMVKVGMNLEFKLGIIGPGTVPDNEMDGKGFFLKAGVKFLTSPTFYQRGVQYAHPLKGFYIKPELIYSSFTMTQEYGGGYPYYQNTVEKVTYNNGAVNIVFGKQHVLGQIITIDYYLGLGYGFQSSSEEPNLNGWNTYFEEYCYSHMLSSSNFAYSGGLTIGVLF